MVFPIKRFWLIVVGESFVCRSLRQEDDEAVRVLVESTFTTFLGGKFWGWKYLQNPSFDSSFVAVAEDEGKIVGCNHWLLRRFMLSGSVVVDATLGADIAVVPDYRKKGVGRALIYFLRSQHANRKLPVMYMFANPELRKRFHTPVAGYVPAPGGTALYTKILNWNKVRASAAAFNERMKHGEFGDRLRHVDLTVVFRVHGAPSLSLHLSVKGVEADVSEKGADVTVSGGVATLSLVKGEGGSTWGLVRALLTGRLKLRANVRKMFALYRNLWVFRQVFSGKIT
jgi:predicted N-acetyltransferase YhbS